MNRDLDLLRTILAGRSDANIRFHDLRILLLGLGFTERTRSSHHIFRREGIPDLINLQRDGSHAKAYQVRQVRRILLRYNLVGDDDA
ncbi:MAG: type II toxin-antitoxin system HicA family toxin [Chloroflexota bacterium]|nr:type II toxin-antitoxin system HicA family toxin [Chloroflexota bacterium]